MALVVVCVLYCPYTVQTGLKPVVLLAQPSRQPQLQDYATTSGMSKSFSIFFLPLEADTWRIREWLSV